MNAAAVVDYVIVLAVDCPKCGNETVCTIAGYTTSDSRNSQWFPHCRACGTMYSTPVKIKMNLDVIDG